MSEATKATAEVPRFSYEELAELEVIALSACEPDCVDDGFSACHAFAPICSIYMPD